MLDNNGELMEGFPVIHDRVVSGVSIADIDGDGKNEIICGTAYPLNSVYAFNDDGSLAEGFPLFTKNPISSAPIILDIDGGVNIGIGDYAGEEHYFYVWALDAPYNPETMEWPMFQHDSQNTGLYGYEPPEPISCIPETEVCDGKDNNCDGGVDEEVNCGEDSCGDWGLNYCGEEGNLYHSKLCIKSYCEGAKGCQEESYSEEELVETCEDNCVRPRTPSGEATCVSGSVCKKDGERCRKDEECCKTIIKVGERTMIYPRRCLYGTCGKQGKGEYCRDDGSSCRDDDECCNGICIRGECGEKEAGDDCSEGGGECGEGLTCLEWTCVIDEGEASCIPPGETCVNSESCCSSKDRCYANAYQEPKCWDCKSEGSGCGDNDECCSSSCEGILFWKKCV